MKFLVSNVEVYVAKSKKKVAVDDDEDKKKALNIMGYISVHEEKILGLTGDSANIAESLLAFAVQQNKLKQVRMSYI